jgi:transposase
MEVTTILNRCHRSRGFVYEQWPFQYGQEEHRSAPATAQRFGRSLLKLIRERCSEALHILDRSHIVAKMNQALGEVRAEESVGCNAKGATRC